MQRSRKSVLLRKSVQKQGNIPSVINQKTFRVKSGVLSGRTKEKDTYTEGQRDRKKRDSWMKKPQLRRRQRRKGNK